AALAASVAGSPDRQPDGYQCRQAIVLPFRPAEFDGHVLSFDIAGIFQTLAKCAQVISPSVRRCDVPITGMVACCARAASGHAAAAPPSSVMNSRRLRSSMGSSPEPAVPAYRRLRMHRKRESPWSTVIGPGHTSDFRETVKS